MSLKNYFRGSWLRYLFPMLGFLSESLQAPGVRTLPKRPLHMGRERMHYNVVKAEEDKCSEVGFDLSVDH